MSHITFVVRASVAVLLAVVVVSPARAGGGGPGGSEKRVLERAIRLLPKPPGVPIRLIDPELAPDPESIRRLDAFLVRETDGTLRQAIYLNRRSSIVENALGGRDLDVGILAAVIQHEIEHLRGGDERAARRVERDFFQSLIFTGKVPVDDGIAYLHDLEQHRRLREG